MGIRGFGSRCWGRSAGRKGPPTDTIDFGKLIKEALEETYEERGHADVLIAGRTGVGKSTLINSVFQGNLARTGQGRPVASRGAGEKGGCSLADDDYVLAAVVGGSTDGAG